MPSEENNVQTVRILVVAIAALILWLLGVSSDARPVRDLATQSAARRYNILFVLTDDQAAHSISAYGSRLSRTPNMDRLAHEGMLFRNAFVTNSICAPSRAVILTGKYSHLNGVLNHSESSEDGVKFDGTQQAFPKLLQQIGYQTAVVGKWHLRGEPVGFDDWSVLAGNTAQGTYYNPRFQTRGGAAQFTGYTTHIITDLFSIGCGESEIRPGRFSLCTIIRLRTVLGTLGRTT